MHIFYLYIYYLYVTRPLRLFFFSFFFLTLGSNIDPYSANPLYPLVTVPLAFYSNFYNAKKSGNGRNKKRKKKPSRDKNGNFFCYNCNEYGYIVKRYFKPPKKQKTGNNNG